MLILFISLTVLYAVITHEWAMIGSYVAAVLIHELGHITVAYFLGVKLRFSEISPWGLKLKFDFYKASLIKETIISLAGSVFGILSSLIIMLLDSELQFSGSFVSVSLGLSILNLLPIKNLDGGQILENFLSSKFLPTTALNIFTAVSGIFAIAFWIGTVWLQMNTGVNLSLLMISVYFLFSNLVFI